MVSGVCDVFVRVGWCGVECAQCVEATRVGRGEMRRFCGVRVRVSECRVAGCVCEGDAPARESVKVCVTEWPLESGGFMGRERVWACGERCGSCVEEVRCDLVTCVVAARRSECCGAGCVKNCGSYGSAEYIKVGSVFVNVVVRRAWIDLTLANRCAEAATVLAAIVAVEVSRNHQEHHLDVH